MGLLQKDRKFDSSPSTTRTKPFIQSKESPVDPFFKPAIQTKLKIGKSNDKFEQEADRVADKVVSQSKGDSIQKKGGEEEIQQKPIASEVTPLVQKSEATEDEPVQKSAAEEEKVQKQEEEEAVQAKGQEEEAVQMMEEEEAVQTKTDEEAVQKEEEEEAVQSKKESIQMQEEEEAVQTKSEAEEETVQKQEEEEAVQSKKESIQKQEEEEAVQTKLQTNGSAGKSSSIESRLNSSKGGGQKLSGKTKHEMESGFGSDFSNVNIHTDENAAQLSKDLGAKAFAHGNDIYFNKGQFNPESSEGKHLLAHELTHTIQQKGMVQKKVQRHMQSTYPWDGVVSARWSAAVREVPAKKKWIADIPKGTRLTVIGNSGNWLQVRVMVGGMQRTGYMSQELVSLAKHGVTSEMESMVGEKAKWVGSGPSRLTGKTNTFVSWAEAKTEADAPKVESVTTINCWEMVLLAAYRSGAITWKFIHDLYLNTKGSWGKELPNRLTKGGQKSYDVATKKPTPKRGQLVFFDGAAHVALATGSGDKILTFWPPPNTKFTSGGTVDDVKVSTISALYTYMKKNMKTPKVTIGNPIW